MKTISASKMKPMLNSVLDAAQRERIIVTRNGKPSAVVMGIEAYDEEDFQLASSEDFWRMIESRRREGRSIPLAELKAQLGIDGASRKKTSARAAGKSRSVKPRKKQ